MLFLLQANLHCSIVVAQADDDIMRPAVLIFSNAAVPESWIPGFKGYVEGIRVLEGVVQEVLKVGGSQAVRSMPTHNRAMVGCCAAVLRCSIIV